MRYLWLSFICITIWSCKKESSKSYNRQEVLNGLIEQEDTDGDNKITIDDKGPKEITFVNKDGSRIKVESTYQLSNLLQELALTKDSVAIDTSRITEKPTYRLSRLIKTVFWDSLTRSIDRKGLKKVLQDSKSSVDSLRLYIPREDQEAISYFRKVAPEFKKLSVNILPKEITPEYVKSINTKPGILTLDHSLEGAEYRAKPFVVPGGRFNEMYGWDSYFESVGLLIDGREDLAMSMADNFRYQIIHYGKILNANRTYYLTRTQPPFFSSLLVDIYKNNPKVSKEWLSKNLKAAIQEYNQVWMQKNVRLTNSGLNRYFGEGIGIPPETEEGHFDFILEQYAKKYELPVDEFVEKYQKGSIKNDSLDQYFTHDRSMRESGHDTSNRLNNVCANLNTVGINSLLYKYETDFAFLIKSVFNDNFKSNGNTYTSQTWLDKAASRKKRMNQYLWDEEENAFYDYNFVTRKKQKMVAATNFFPLWAKICSPEQAEKMVAQLFAGLVQKGGVAGTQNLTKETLFNAPARQWDYPNGWAPHQMLTWQGLLNYGYQDEAQELIYRWLWLITKNAVDYNGVIPEKYDVVKCTHKVFAEYGNVGTEFDYITPSGFGWMNASYQLGLQLLKPNFRIKLDNLTDPNTLFKPR